MSLPTLIGNPTILVSHGANLHRSANVPVCLVLPQPSLVVVDLRNISANREAAPFPPDK